MKDKSHAAGMFYFDNAAAVPIASETLELYRELTLEYQANQEAGYRLAYLSRYRLEQAEKELSLLLTGQSGNGVLWGDSATVLFHAAMRLPYSKNGNIVVGGMEHPALAAAFAAAGLEIRKMPMRGMFPDLDQAVTCFDGNTVLVAVPHVQGETGAIQNIAALHALRKQHSPRALLLVDTVQSAGKLSIPWMEAKLDFIFVSGHKIGAPGGAAMLYRNRQWTDFFVGMRKQQYLLSRAEPARMITLAEVLKKNLAKTEKSNETVCRVNAYLRQSLRDYIMPDGKKVILTVPAESASPYILHIMLPGYDGGVLVRMFSEHGVSLSSGSACRAESGKPSEMLLAAGIAPEDAYSGLRLSFWKDTRREDAEAFMRILRTVLEKY